MLTPQEIIDKNTDLINKCIDIQFSRLKDKQWKEDFRNDLFLTLLSYDEEKLRDADDNNHFNALVTAIIVNNLWSRTSPYFKAYKKFDLRTQEITDKELNIGDDD